MKKGKPTVPLWVILLGSVVIIFLASMLFIEKEEIIKQDVDEYNEGWKYSIGGEEFKEIDKLPLTLENDDLETLTLTNTLPEIYEEKSLMFRSSNQFVKVYADNELIYSFGDEKVSFLKTPGSYWNFVTINKRYSGKEIRIELESPFKDCSGFISVFSLGSEYSEKLQMIEKQSVNFLLCILIGVIGLAMILYQIFVDKHRKQFGFGYLGLFAFTVSIWSILETQLIQFIIDKPSLLTVITFLSLILLPVPLSLFMREVFYEKGNKYIEVIIYLSFANFVVQTLFQLTGVRDYYQMVLASHFIILLTVIEVNYILIKRSVKDRDEKISYILIGTVALFGLGIVDMIRYYTGSFGDYSAGFRIGVIIFSAFMAVYYSKKMEGIREKLINVILYEKLAFEDVLTGCKNRSFFENEIRKAVEGSLEANIYIVTFDMNNLKYNNDHFGHPIGDKLIIACGQSIAKAFVGNTDVCRIGGDEFAIVLKGVSEEYIKTSLRRLEEHVKEYNENNFFELEIAYGYALYDRKIDKNLESVMSRADKKMYYKKNLMKVSRKESKEYNASFE